MKKNHHFGLVTIISLVLLLGSNSILAAGSEICRHGETYTDSTTCYIYSCEDTNSGDLRGSKVLGWVKTDTDQQCAERKAAERLRDQTRGGGAGSGTNVTPEGPAKKGLAPPRTKKVNYSSQITNTTSAVNFDYSNPTTFPPCEIDPSRLSVNQLSTTSNIDSAINTVPAYPDINSRMATKGASLPKDQCTVTSLVLCKIGDEEKPCTNTHQKITKAIYAVCPDGYVQVGSYNMQPEVVYTDFPPEAPYPITSYSDYETYYNQGYSCGPMTNESYTATACSDYSVGITPDVISNTYFKGPPRNQPMEIYNGMTFTGQNPNQTNISASVNNPGGATKIVGQFYQLNLEPTPRNPSGAGNHAWGYCYSNYTCDSSGRVDCEMYCGITSPMHSNSVTTSPQYGTDETYWQCTNDGIAYSHFWQYKYYPIKCTAPASLTYFTTNMAPRSLVCARIKSQYDPSN